MLKQSVEVSFLCLYCFYICIVGDNYLIKTYPKYTEYFTLFNGIVWYNIYGLFLHFGSWVDPGASFANFILGIGRSSVNLRNFFAIMIVSCLTGIVATFYLKPEEVGIALPSLEKSNIHWFVTEAICAAIVAFSARILASNVTRVKRSLLQHSVLVQGVTLVSRGYTSGGAHVNALYTAACIGLQLGYEVVLPVVSKPELQNVNSILKIVESSPKIVGLLFVLAGNLTGQIIAAAFGDYEELLRTPADKNLEIFLEQKNKQGTKTEKTTEVKVASPVKAASPKKATAEEETVVELVTKAESFDDISTAPVVAVEIAEEEAKEAKRGRKEKKEKKRGDDEEDASRGVSKVRNRKNKTVEA